jgi:hypothetical protein
MNSGLEVPFTRLILSRASVIEDEIAAVDGDGKLTAWGDTDKVIKSVTCGSQYQTIRSNCIEGYDGAYRSCLPIVHLVRCMHQGL